MRAGQGLPGEDRPAAPDVDFAVDVMDLAPGQRVLDLACAWGRTTLELARRGLGATGLDIAPELVAIARVRAEAEGLDVPFVVAPVRRMPELGRFDAVTEFYDDSVISHVDAADDLAALRGVAERLRPGGRFLFGTGDYPRRMPAYQRREREEPGQRVVEEIRYEEATRTGTSARTHVGADRSVTYRRVRRHYAPDEVADLLRASGLRLVDVWCGYRRDLAYDRGSEGMVVLAERDANEPGSQSSASDTAAWNSSTRPESSHVKSVPS
jgi:SAM-dependent methyltransferase